MVKKMFHTQEKHGNDVLNGPILCEREDAWLGNAYYFWYEERHAIMWGNKSKKRTGYYEVYSCNIKWDTDKIIDTVFNEAEYNFWVSKIEKAAVKFAKDTGKKPSLKQINDYFVEKGIYKDVDGVLFQDISKNPDDYIVNDMQYRKRIQFGLFNIKIISNFAPHYTGKCV